MKAFMVFLMIIVVCFLSGGVTGYYLVSSGVLADTNPACDSIQKEERQIFDRYTFLLNRDEIRLEEDRRSIEREFHDTYMEVVKESARKGCI